MPSLEQRALDRIIAEYAAPDRDAAKDLLGGYAGPEPDRVLWDILALSRGDSQRLLHFLDCAQHDYRDVLYWVEYYDYDPMLRHRDPKQLVEELLAKWVSTSGV